MDIERYNADWLAAWTAKDVDRLLSFYAEDCVYRDPQTAAGIVGHPALRGYLEQLFAATPAMTYVPDEVWAIPGGYCGRWYCDIAGGGRLRGFDLVLMASDRITLNEVYTHQIPETEANS